MTPKELEAAIASAERELEAAIAFAEQERDEAYRAYRRALHGWGDADQRLLSALLDLEDLHRTTDTERKASK